MERLPEEVELEQARGGLLDGEEALAIEAEARVLIALALGTAILLAVLMVALLAAYATTGWRALLWLNLVVVGMAMASFAYLVYRRNRLTLRL